ncbi:hypothetical protein HU200_038983 [Digitaria exilis]|uniref:Protein phosphatase n=1 Tax=Digitaria exilis TaxID=1010633 RepID=A0A835BHV6_9POAL|nr:hypothetical protein HU200_038983 [Digitaria exilis]
MEKLEQIHQTLGDIDARVPDALRVALGLGYRAPPTPAPGEADEVADLAASLLQPPPATEVGADPTEHDAAAAAAAAALRIDWASCYVPLHDHDAHFGDASAGVLGVADGVGAYAESGVDAGAFARGLMSSASAAAAELAEHGAHVCPRALLERAHDATAKSGAPGASTAVILSLAVAGNAHLEWAYIGDSAFAVLRRGKVVLLSTPQRHLSHPPFQLSAAGERSDSVSDAMAGRLAVRAGDVVLELAVQMGTRLGFSPKNMADIIAGVAYERSNQTSSKRLCKGKPDDITVLVAFIVQSDL